LQLALQYAPVLLFFPATSGPFAAASGEPATYDFSRLGFEGSDVAAELTKQLGVKIPYSKPLQWKLIGTVATTTVLIVSSLVILIPKIAASKSFSISFVWKFVIQAAILMTIVIMCAGQMWNSIRHAPYMAMGQNGKPEYFAGGFQSQYGAETQIVALVCE
jgi:oligosaccharyltransferase complex subunit gamma